MKKFVNALHLPFGLLLSLQLLLTSPVKSATPEIDVTMQYGIGPFDYNSLTHRIAWLSGQGICSGEIQSPATLSMNSPYMLLYANNDTGMACNGNPEALTSNEAYIYFTQGGGLWRLAVSAPKTQAPDRLPLVVTRGFTPAAVALAGTDLFWFESNGTSTKLWKSSGPGTNTSILLFTGNYGSVHKMKVFYDIGSFNFPLTCCFLGDDGRLWKVLLDPVGTPALMASNVRDFDMRVEESTSIFIPPFYRVFAMQDTQAWAIHLNTLSSTVIYPVGPPPSGKTLGAIAVDTNRVYLIEKFSVPCGPFSCVNYNVLRQERPTNDSTVRPWTVFGLATDNKIVNPHSLFATGPLYSYGSLLVWADGNTTRSLAADAPPISLNLRAMGLEVVQAIQNLDNSVPLVNGKHTYVRAYATADFNTTGQSKFLASGVLNVSQRMQPSQSFTPLGTLNPVKASPVDTNRDLSMLRSDLAHSYLFELPRAWTQFPELHCEFVVNGDHAFTENFGFDPYGDNSAASSVSFVSVQQQCWVFVAVKTVPDTYYPMIERNYSKFWEIVDRAKSMLPVNDVQIVTWPDLIGPVFSTGDAKFELKNSGDWANARAALACWTIGRSMPCWCTRYIGTVSPNAGTNANVSGIGGTRPFFANSCVVRMEPKGPSLWDFPRGGEIIAHELGHNFGRDHVNCGSPASIDANYPYPSCTMTIPDLTSPSAHFGFDTIGLNVINPASSGDLMSYAATTWPSDYTWKAILFSGEFCFPSGGAQAQAASLAVSPAAADSAATLVFAGSIDRESDRIGLFPSFLVPEGILNSTLRTAGVAGVNPTYTFRLVDGAGHVLNEGLLALEESDGWSTVNTFVQAVTAPQGLAAVQILHYGIVRAEHRMSPHAPVVSIGQPVVDSVTHALQCDWTGTDLDGDRLAYTVQYSSDNGASWIPLQMANPNTSLRVDVRELAGGSQCKLRVIASDGLQCSIATSDPFVIPNNPPVAVIVGLHDGDRLTFGQPLTITGIGHDLEDGMLSDARLQWNISGPDSLLPFGEKVALTGLTPGSYTAVLTVTDSAGASGSNTVHFEVLPLSVPERPAPVLDGIAADGAYVNVVEIPFSTGSQRSYARISHSPGYLNVAFSDVPFAIFGSPISVGIVLDTNRTQHASPQSSEVGFYIDENGIPAQRNGDGSTMALNSQPSLGVKSAFFRQGNAWSAELQIPESLIGGWGHEAAALVNLRDEANVTAVVWPPNASLANPASWAHALFGVSPVSSNRPPIAIAQSLHVIRGVPGQVVVLDGSKSFDPDGQPLIYQWSQIAGPAVSIQNAAAATASFIVPNTNPALLTFRLVVNDGSLSSAPSELNLATYSIALNPQPFPPIFTDSSSSADGALDWSGITADRAVIEASQDLKTWIPIGTNTVDFDALLHFRDPNAAAYPWRFYRAHGLSSTTSLIYSNNFEGAVGAEWSSTTTAVTPVGARRFLGRFGAQNVSLTLPSLPAHTRLKVSCDLFIIGAWDGNVGDRVGPDVWQLVVHNGATLLDATFSTYYSQSYPGDRSDSFPARTNAAENDTLGYVSPGGGGGDCVYHLEFTFDHTDPSLLLDFNGLGLVTSGDETWGIDNVVIHSIYNP